LTLEELYIKERVRIKKLAFHYAKMFNAEPEDLFQEGALALSKVYTRYACKLTDEELLKVSHLVINRKMYKYARSEYKHKASLRP